MSTNLNTKIQYKTCEKGEFFDEQPRSLDEILELIKNFPWDAQRGTDIQLSGPGIVIEGETGDYLKIALYFNGKFSAYYLDADNHLYEYHTPELEEDCQKVKEFFDGKLNLDGFDKHFFNIGNRGHFVSRSFEYTISIWKAVWPPVLIGSYITFILIVITGMNNTATVMISLGMLLVVLMFIASIYFTHNNMYLKLSKGHDDFWFGDNTGKVKHYNKQDIKEVIIYQGQKGRGSGPFSYTKINFKDGSLLKIPNIIIPSLTLMTKFKDDIIHIEYRGRWRVWN